MEMNLTFAHGFIAGEGNDDVGRFFIKGRYEADTRECHWIKSYVGAHDVFYRGFREGKGIWGTWEIAIRYHGGFHIWPRGAGEGDWQKEASEQVQPVDAISPPTNAPVETKTLSQVRQSLIRTPIRQSSSTTRRSTKHIRRFLPLLLSGGTALACFSVQVSAADWLQFRGPNCSGVAADATPPIQISPTNGALWSSDIPWSPSSPCVSGAKIFLTTFADSQLQTRCYAGDTGRLVWSKGIQADTLELFHNSEGSPAAATPASDGRHVVSYFGSFGLISYDFQGKELFAFRK